jgi:type IV pilus assembly protein PilA
MNGRKPPPAAATLRRGFTLIELMIVVAIMGIMATLAVPTYQDRIIQAQVKEGLQLAVFMQEAVAERYTAQRQWARDNAAAGLPPPEMIVGRVVSAAEVRDGSIVITYGNQSNRFLAGKTLALRPATVPGYPKVPISWVCGLAAVPDKMSAPPTNATTLPLSFLPLDCRGR